MECRSLHRSGSLTTVAQELARYKSNFVGKQEARRDKQGTVRAGDYIFSMTKETKIITFKKDFLYTTE